MADQKTEEKPSGSDNLNSLVRRFAVAVTRTRDLKDKMNIESQIFDLEAYDSDHAVGIAIRESQKQSPNHTVFLTTWVEIQPNESK